MPSIDYTLADFSQHDRYMLAVNPLVSPLAKAALDHLAQVLAYKGIAMTVHPYDVETEALVGDKTSILGHELVLVRGVQSVTQKGNVTYILLEKASGDTVLTVVDDR